jgi:hypothetical protein
LNANTLTTYRYLLEAMTHLPMSAGVFDNAYQVLQGLAKQFQQSCTSHNGIRADAAAAAAAAAAAIFSAAGSGAHRLVPLDKERL